MDSLGLILPPNPLYLLGSLLMLQATYSSQPGAEPALLVSKKYLSVYRFVYIGTMESTYLGSWPVVHEHQTESFRIVVHILYDVPSAQRLLVADEQIDAVERGERRGDVQRSADDHITGRRWLVTIIQCVQR